MKQQIVVSGTGGQGVLLVTRFFAEAAMALNLEVITSEIHGMAMRGGTVLSHVKIGPFKSPLIREGMADIGIILNEENLSLHKSFVKPRGLIFLNKKSAVENCITIDATGLAYRLESPGSANLILLGFAIGSNRLFCDKKTARDILFKISKVTQVDANIKVFEEGIIRNKKMK